MSLLGESHTSNMRSFLITACAWLRGGGGQGRTQIKFCTDGVLLREMMDDPLLSAYR